MEGQFSPSTFIPLIINENTEMLTYTPLILDLKGLVMNSYHACMTTEPLYGENGKPINTAEKGFETFLSKFFDPMLEICPSPIHMIAVVDDGNTYRKTLYPDYKKGRPDAQAKQDPIQLAELEKAMTYAKSFLAALGVPIVRLAGQEADDVIAFLVEKLHQFSPVTVATIVRDLLQLHPKAGIFRNGLHQTEYQPNVPNELIPLYSSIVGKGTGEFPGVVGLGEKAWESLVESFGLDGMAELQALVEKRDNATIRRIAEKAQHKTLTKLANCWDEWLKQFLVSKLCPEICVGAKIGLEFYKRCPTLDRLEKALAQAGALGLIFNYKKFCYTATLVTQDNLDESLARINQLLPDTPAVPFDYETTDYVQDQNRRKAANGRGYVDVLNSSLTGASFAFGDAMQHVFYFSVDHSDTNNVEKSVVLELLKMVEDKGLDTVAHNLSFEATVTKCQLGYELLNGQDTYAYSHYLDENSDHDLKFLSKTYLNYIQATYSETLAAYGANNMAELTGEQVLSYGADDSLVTGQLYTLFTLLTRLEGNYSFIRDYECPATMPLVDSYIDGVKIDKEEMDRQRAQDEAVVATEFAKINAMLETYCGEPNYAAVDALYEDQKAYIYFKATRTAQAKNPLLTPTELAAAGSQAQVNYRDKLKAACVYIKPYEIKNFKEFIPTPTKLTEVATKLGLPEITTVSRIGLSNYLSDAFELDPSPEAREWLAQLRDAIPEFKDRKGEFYDAFKTACDAITEAHTPPTMAGTVLNLGSPTQLTSMLYLMLGLPIRMRTEVQPDSLRHLGGLPGSPSTDKSAIDFALANDCEGEVAWKAELLTSLSTYQKADTRISNYWTPYPLWMDEQGIMHPSFRIPGTVTRRPAGSNPNMLQVSKGEVRKAVVPRLPDSVIVSIDFASQELRVMAALTQDKNFLSAYIHPADEPDKDLHTMTGCGVAPVLARRKYGDLLAQMPLDADGKVEYQWYLDNMGNDNAMGKFLKKTRGTSKTINFGAGYGATAQTVSEQAMIPLEDAELAVDGMLATYPGINLWKAEVYKFAKKFGYVETTYGSRRHCGNDLMTGNRRQVGRWERQLSNFLIQGQCGDLLKVVLAGAWRSRLFPRLNAYLLAPIYDEILAEVPRVNVYQYICEMSDLMEVYMPGICVPMVADVSFGPNWMDQREVGVRPSKEKVESVLTEIFGDEQ